MTLHARPRLIRISSAVYGCFLVWVLVHRGAVPNPVAVRYAWGAADRPKRLNVEGLPPASIRAKEWSPEPKWESLIKGNTLDGWVQRGGKAKYHVEDGAIVGTSVPGTPNSFLCSEREFGDFELELEFKVDPRLNSGIQIRSNSVPGYRNGVVHGYQVEIDPGERAWSAGIYDESRRGWLFPLKDNEAARNAFKQNEWNHTRIVAVGDSIKTWINGVVAADLTDSLTRIGFIGLQVHGTKQAEPMQVRWRNIRVKDLGVLGVKPPPAAIVLLDESGDLSHWEHAGKPGSSIKWRFKDGALEVEPRSGSIVTKRVFGDCRLHLEFNVDDNGKQGQANGNSGVYIQRRYEVQILNSAGQQPADNICGGIYKVKPADFNMARPAGQWQTYDITFRAPRWDAEGKKVAGARITVYHNGTHIHDDIEIPHKTGGGQPEGAQDGALLLQDHGNRIRFRNIWIVALK